MTTTNIWSGAYLAPFRTSPIPAKKNPGFAFCVESASSPKAAITARAFAPPVELEEEVRLTSILGLRKSISN